MLAVQIYFWVFLFQLLLKPGERFSKYNHNKMDISLLVCSKNALHHLKQNLSHWLNQKYSNFELIIIDDHSTDGSLQWLQQQSAKSPILKIHSCAPGVSGKKQALYTGVQFAKYKLLALTDADCTPSSPHWLEKLANKLGDHKEIVLAYAPYFTRPGWLNKLIRFETVLNMMQTGGAALCGKPYAATGRNLLYLRSIFDRDAMHPELPYGDDDFLIHHKANSSNTAVCLNPDSFVYTEAEITYRSYFLQKWRHYSSSKKYSISSKLILLTFYGSLFCFYLGLFLSCIQGKVLLALLLFSIKMLICWPVFCKTCNLLREQRLCLYYPLLEIIYLLHLCIQLPFLAIRKKTW